MIKIWKDQIRKQFLDTGNKYFAQGVYKEEELRDFIRHMLDEAVYKDRAILSEQDKVKVTEELYNEFTGFGPIEPFLKDPDITEIMINGPKKVYIEKFGKKQLTNVTFEDENKLMSLVYKILSPTRRHVDEFSSYTDVSMEDGSRVNIIIPPLALDGPVVTIRKFLKVFKKIEDLIKAGTLNNKMADFLVDCVKAGVNIIFTGATGAGKTTTLNVLSSYISVDERIVTIEDTAELSLSQEHVVRMESKQPNIEGKGEVTIRDLFRNSLRMRPERIILGEIRGAEALDMLQAICSGHTGSLAILHANSPQDAIYRLETMILTSGLPITLEAIHRQISTAINLIVQQEQLPDGSRKITHITQINGLKDGQVILEDIFKYDFEKTDGNFKGIWQATGIVPAFYPLFQKEGIAISQEIFAKG